MPRDRSAESSGRLSALGGRRAAAAAPSGRPGRRPSSARAPAGATVVFVGEQPGDQEDRGAAVRRPGRALLDDALEQAGIDRSAAYVTNAVKHFKWEARGKRRIHQKPNWSEMAACRPWLEAELAVVRPQVLVCLGATAAQALLGRQFRVTKQRGRGSSRSSPSTSRRRSTRRRSCGSATDEARHMEMTLFVEDLQARGERA